MSAALLNILIGLITSILSAGSALLCRRAIQARALNRKSAFFGLTPGSPCLIVLNDHWQLPGATSHNDVHTLLEISALAHESGCPVSVVSTEGLREHKQDSVEFCIGGPQSNPRTAAHISAYLPGLRFRPISTKSDSGAFIIGGRKFLFKRGQKEHAIVAKFTPAHTKHPVILIYGQRPIDNRAAINFLNENYRQLSKAVDSVDRFCLVVQVTSPDAYGYQAAELAADVTPAAFAAPNRTAGGSHPEPSLQIPGGHSPS